MRSQTRGYIYNTLLLIMVVLAVVVACENNANRTAQPPATRPAVSTIQNKEQLDRIIAASGDRLLVFEFSADWCPPCRKLAPILEEIAKENREVLDLYKIDTDKSSSLARDFRVTGIPHVVFFKNKESVMSLSGLYPKQMYVKVISRLTPMVADKKSGGMGGT
jgi:thioredoxin 1